jgi:hypothetical protein
MNCGANAKIEDCQLQFEQDDKYCFSAAAVECHGGGEFIIIKY